MTSTDVALAIDLAAVEPDEVCVGLNAVIPVLHGLKTRTSSWKFWMRGALSLVISALEAWRRERCGR